MTPVEQLVREAAGRLTVAALGPQATMAECAAARRFIIDELTRLAQASEEAALDAAVEQCKAVGKVAIILGQPKKALAADACILGIRDIAPGTALDEELRKARQDEVLSAGVAFAMGGEKFAKHVEERMNWLADRSKPPVDFRDLRRKVDAGSKEDA